MEFFAFFDQINNLNIQKSVRFQWTSENLYNFSLYIVYAKDIITPATWKQFSTRVHELWNNDHGSNKNIALLWPKKCKCAQPWMKSR